MSARNIRAYQARRLLAPPVRAGRNAYYGEAHVHRLQEIQALQRENKDTLWGSMVKQTMQRKNPAFNESYYGYSTFSKLLEEAQKQKIVTLEKDSKSGTYIITSVEEGRAA